MAFPDLEKGDAACSSGLSKRMFDTWTGLPVADSGLADPLEGAAEKCVKAMCWAFASAVVDELQANG